MMSDTRAAASSVPVSNRGLEDATEGPRDESLCAHAILSDGLLEVTDALADPRFSNQALQVFAQVLLDSFRGSDVIARLGGDEFAVLLSNTCESQARRILHCLDEALDTHNASARRGYKLAYSAGVHSEQSLESTDLAELLRKVDQALYEEKRKRAMRRAEKAMG